MRLQNFLTLVCAMLMLTLTSSFSYAQQSTKSYTCDGLKRLIAKRGNVRLTTKNKFVFDRFVANAGNCPRTSYFLQNVRVPSKSGTCTLQICADEDIRTGRD